jgi:mono/diheme cytochrome c family protein
MRRSLLPVIRALVLTAALACAAFAFVVWRGLYDVSATAAHLQPVHDLLELAMHRSVKTRARDVAVPPLTSPALVARGAVCYRDACVQCHGGPGVAQQPFAMSLQPLPGPLLDAAKRWHPNELYWITRHGIKMSGMPAWAMKLNDGDLWALVAFLQQLPSLSPREYGQRMASVAGQSCPTAQSCADGACPSHSTQAVVGSRSDVGPPLEGLWRRTLIAGKLPRTEEALARWIRHPQEIDPETAMPDMGVSEAHAKEIAAYLLQPR